MKTIKRPLPGLVVLLLLAALTFIASCKKSDLRLSKEKANDPEENTFFEKISQSNPQIQRVADEFEMKSRGNNLLSNFTKQYGTPLWDKGFVLNRTRKNPGPGESTIDTTVIIPVVKENAHEVESYIEAHLSDKVSLIIVSDHGYRTLPLSNAQVISNEAEKLTVRLMLLNQQVFGHDEFHVHDNRLFHGSNNYADAGKLSRKIKLKTSSDNNRMVTICVDIITTYYHCQWVGYCAGENGSCDNCSQCTTTTVQTTCESWWESDGGGGSGGGGTGGGDTGGGGGGGGTGGGGDNDPCDGINPVRVEPCDDPPGDDDPIDPVPDPVYHQEGFEVESAHFDSWDIQNFPPQNLPSFADFNTNYPKDAAGDELGVPETYQMAGGPLYNAYLNNTVAYGNACALRTSIALVKSGINIPHIRSQNPDGSFRDVTRQGANGKYYFITANDLYNWMKQTFGTPPATHVVTSSEAIGGNFAGQLPTDNGIYIMRALDRSQFGATGHVTLFQGGNAVQGGLLYGNNNDVGGGIRDVTLWKLN